MSRDARILLSCSISPAACGAGGIGLSPAFCGRETEAGDVAPQMQTRAPKARRSPACSTVPPPRPSPPCPQCRPEARGPACPRGPSGPSTHGLCFSADGPLVCPCSVPLGPPVPAVAQTGSRDPPGTDGGGECCVAPSSEHQRLPAGAGGARCPGGRAWAALAGQGCGRGHRGPRQPRDLLRNPHCVPSGGLPRPCLMASQRAASHHRPGVGWGRRKQRLQASSESPT